MERGQYYALELNIANMILAKLDSKSKVICIFGLNNCFIGFSMMDRLMYRKYLYDPVRY